MLNNNNSCVLAPVTCNTRISTWTRCGAALGAVTGTCLRLRLKTAVLWCGVAGDV
jgi:hypothetical protein